MEEEELSAAKEDVYALIQDYKDFDGKTSEISESESKASRKNPTKEKSGATKSSVN